MDIKTFPLGPLETNCYVASVDGSAVAVDVGGDPAEVTDYLRAAGLTLQAILLTHLHCDHLYGVAALADTFGVKVLAGAEDAPLLESELGQGGFMGLPRVPLFSWEPVAPGSLSLLGQTCRVLATPGHSLGSRSYAFPESGVVFVGDLLFYRSIGRTDFAGGDFDSLIASVKTQIFTLPADTVVYPGHGLATTVADEQLANPYFTEFTR
jgi:glyoxylase-like metal-dependent hydrolase (beta-lactamase superfamily II)